MEKNMPHDVMFANSTQCGIFRNKSSVHRQSVRSSHSKSYECLPLQGLHMFPLKWHRGENGWVRASFFLWMRWEFYRWGPNLWLASIMDSDLLLSIDTLYFILFYKFITLIQCFDFISHPWEMATWFLDFYRFQKCICYI